MNFARAKTILIFIFIFVNIFLLVVYNFLILDHKTIDEKTLMTVLANNNITVDSSVISTEEVTVNGVEVINSGSDRENFLESVLGKKYKKIDENTFNSEKMSVIFSSSLVEITTKDNKDKKYKDINELNAGNKVLSTLGKMDFDKSHLSAINVIKNPKGDFYITVNYSYDDLPVFNHHINVFADSSGIKNIKGSVLSFKELKNQSYDLISVSEVLLDFINLKGEELKNGETNIIDVKRGYFLNSGELPVSTYAIPAYEIKLKDGRLFYFDARKDIDPAFKKLGMGQAQNN